MPFSDKPDYESRRFLCGWAPRAEGAAKLASRLKAIAAGLESVELGLGDLWPQFEARRLRPTDPGPLLALSDEDLARLIDRRGRSSPPAFPAAVGPEGYHFALAGRREAGADFLYGLSIWVDNMAFGTTQAVHLSFGNDNPIWRSYEKARGILLALVEAWDAGWACANAFVGLGEKDDGGSIAQEWPWMAWAAPGCRVPDAWVEDGGPPTEARAMRGGQLSTWPWRPTQAAPP